jgi:hypothetical protein
MARVEQIMPATPPPPVMESKLLCEKTYHHTKRVVTKRIVSKQITTQNGSLQNEFFQNISSRKMGRYITIRFKTYRYTMAWHKTS